MTIEELIIDIRVDNIKGEITKEISSIQFDSRKTEPDSVFVAIKGRTADGHEFIDKAIDRGAVCIVAEHEVEQIPPGVTYLLVKNSAEVLGQMASNFYGRPSHQLTMVGVTGTNGKTTVATLLYRLFTALGNRCGLISTVENRIGTLVEQTTFTTPDPVIIQRLLARMVEAGCTHAFMEVSSHALDQERVAGIAWDGAIFSNITHDHLDYHGDFANYIRAKKKFFDGLSAQAFALVNADDVHGEVMVQNTVAKVSTYSLTKVASFKARVIENRMDGLHLEINQVPVHTRLVGKFNAYNLLAIYGAAVLLGEDPGSVMTEISRLTPAEGRFDVVTGRKAVFAVVDYAHTPDALSNVLSTLIQTRPKNARVICIVGCGGDRDKTKRPEMARIAARMADEVILTSDNPRSEDPEKILDDMWSGLNDEQEAKVLRIADRKEAIRAGVRLAKEGDIILVAGKGHEKYQEIRGQRFPFDDKQVLAEALA